jgi:hypothetical protein
MGLTEHVLILITGKLTEWQLKRAEEKATIRTEKVIRAVKWLCENNPRWSHVDFETMSQQVEHRRPVVRNLSTLVESQDRNKEETEVFQCFYPDDATNEYSGGFDEPGAFRNYVESMQSKGYSVEFRVNLKREFVNKDNHEQLVCGNLLQFPYGRGGPSENREVADKSIKRVYFKKYIKHLSQKSDVVFQSPMIQLLMYSQISKVRLLEYSRLQVRGTVDASRIAESFSPGELDRTIEEWIKSRGRLCVK